MTGIVGGLVAALAWGIASIFGARSSREIGPFVAFACANLVAFAIALPLAFAIQGIPQAPAADWAWTVLYGVAIIGAFLTAFPAMTLGRIGIVAPVIGTDGAMAAIVAILTGETLGALAGAALILVVLGVILSVLQPAPLASAGPRNDRLAVLLALASAACFATSFVAASRATGVSAAWVLATGRGIALVAVTIPILLIRRPRIPRTAWPLVAGNASADVVGTMAFVTASRKGLAIPAVLGSEYAVVTVLYGVIVFRERLTPLQWTGIALTLVGVGVIAGVTA